MSTAIAAFNDHRTLSGPEKVAALLLAMGKPLASRLLKHFDPAELKIITRSAAALGAVTALLLRGVLSGPGRALTPAQGLVVGGATCMALSLGLLGLVLGSPGVVWAPATAGALSFWLVAPMLLYTAAGGAAGWQMARALRPAPGGQVGDRRAPSARHG